MFVLKRNAEKEEKMEYTHIELGFKSAHSKANFKHAVVELRNAGKECKTFNLTSSSLAGNAVIFRDSNGVCVGTIQEQHSKPALLVIHN